MKLIKYILLLISTILTTQIYATVYEDAEDESTSRWHIYDNFPYWAYIDNVYLTDRDHNAIKFIGAGIRNGYMLGNIEGRSGAWNNTTEHTLKWSMNFKRRFVIYVRISTTNGPRYLYYTQHNRSYGKRNRTYIHFGLGREARNGIWQDFTRNLEIDLKRYEPNNNLIDVNAFLVRGKGMVDDIELINENQDDVYIPEESIADIRSIFGNNFRQQFKAIEDSIGLFEGLDEQGQLGRYAYASFLASDYLERGATLGRIFTTGYNKDDFRWSDAYSVIQKLKELDSNLDLVKLVDNVNDYTNDNFHPTLATFENNNYPKDGNNYTVDENHHTHTFLTKFAYEWKKLGNHSNANFQIFKESQDYVVFRDVHGKILSMIKSLNIDLSNITPLTYFIMTDATVLGGADTPSRMLNEIIQSRNYDLNTLADQKNFTLDILNGYSTFDIYSESGRYYRQQALLEMVNTNLNTFTFENVSDIYNTVEPPQ